MNYKAIIPTDIPYFLEGFRKDLYPNRFADYLRNAEPEIRAIPGETASSADALIAFMDSRVTGLFRSRKRVDQKFFLMQYVVPAAIRCGRRDFAQALHDRWLTQHPEHPFGIASYEEFYENFNTTLLGFKIEKEVNRE